MTLVEEECTAILEERGGMDFKIMEVMIAERERWEGRIRAAENGWEATIAVAIAMGGNAKLAWDRYKALRAAIAGDRDRGGREGFCAAEAGTLRGSGQTCCQGIIAQEQRCGDSWQGLKGTILTGW